MPKVSRREFLKFIAAGGIAAAAGFAGFSSIVPRNASRQATAQGPVPWTDGPDTIGHAVHVALLPNGKVLYVGGSGWHRKEFQAGTFQAGIWDPVSGEHHALSQPNKDLFCCGQVPLANGNILLAGGTLEYKSLAPNKKYWGLDAAYEFDYATETFVERDSMAHGRWYPTLVELEDGKILTVEGFDEFGYHNLLTEIYDPETASWSISYDPDTSRQYTVGCDSTGCAEDSNGNPIPGAPGPVYGGTNMGVAPGGLGLYPRMHLLPNGRVAVVGQGATRRIWNPATQKWHGAGTIAKRSYGTSVLLPLQNTTDELGSILVCGGSPTPNAGALNSAQIFKPSSAASFAFVEESVTSMTYPRRYCNPVILPNGKIIIFGGTAQANLPEEAVFVPEMFDPDTKTWSELDPHTIRRIYHSGAILLQDGRVWTMGTSYSVISYETSTEIYSPSYCFGTRPEITDAPSGAEYGGTITIQTPNPAAVTEVSLLKVPTTTHHYNTDQRLIWLQIISRTDSSVTVSAPINSKLAPPGYYMIHVLEGDIPSEGAMIHVTFAPYNPIFYDVGTPGDFSITLQSGKDIRGGVEALSGSVLVGRQLKTWTVNLKRVSAPIGFITAVVRRKSDDSVVAESITEPIPASTLLATYKPYTFTFDPPYNIQPNDRILIEYDGQTGVRMDAWQADKIDGSKTRAVRFKSGSLTYTGGTVMNDRDVSGTMSE
jgi:hypothetical protein